MKQIEEFYIKLLHEADLREKEVMIVMRKLSACTIEERSTRFDEI